MKDILFALVAVVVVLVGSLSSWACVRYGDSGPVTVEYLNRSGVAVTAYQRMGREIASRRALAPGESGRVQFLAGPRDSWASSPPVQIEATDQTGAIIFCRLFPLWELEQLQWRVEIVSGGPPCASS
jgi:hypothetical protein